jgi:putative superfamily III holin-X
VTEQQNIRAPQTAHADTGAAPGESTGDAFAQVGREMADALRREVDQLRSELADRAAAAAKGTGLLAAAGAAGAIAGAALLTIPLIALRRIMPSWLLALAIGGASGGLAAYLAGRGLDELATAAPIDTDRLKDVAKDALRPQ